jgi:drug/metabolite transporter (DMT)-like permease
LKLANTCHPFALITILCWSLAFIFTRITVNYFSAFSLGFLRYFVAALALIAVAVAKKIRPPERGDLKWFLLSGTTGFFLYILTFNKGCETVTASESSMIIATVPALTAVLAAFAYKEKMGALSWISIAIELAGVAIITQVYKVGEANIGFLWLLCAAVLLSVYNVLQRKLTRKYTPLQTTIYSILTGALMLCIFLPGSIKEIRNAPPVQFLYIAILGVFSSAIAYFTWSVAFSKAKETATVSNYMFLTPLLTSALGFVMINESPSKQTVTGGIVVLVGMLAYNMAPRIKGKKAQ